MEEGDRGKSYILHTDCGELKKTQHMTTRETDANQRKSKRTKGKQWKTYENQRKEWKANENQGKTDESQRAFMENQQEPRTAKKHPKTNV